MSVRATPNTKSCNGNSRLLLMVTSSPFLANRIERLLTPSLQCETIYTVTGWWQLVVVSELLSRRVWVIQDVEGPVVSPWASSVVYG